jgi:succinate dehydrogenase/fumarate reductase-like Fe-S protein
VATRPDCRTRPGGNTTEEAAGWRLVLLSSIRRRQRHELRFTAHCTQRACPGAFELSVQRPRDRLACNNAHLNV